MPTSIAALALARLVVRVAEACDGVAAVSPGPSGVAATHGPGGRVPGVVVHPSAPGGPNVTVHLVATLDQPLPQVAERVRAAAVTALAEADPDRAPWTVDVHVSDVIPPVPGRPT